ncbi:uncharacterized protein LOC129305452 [Prosopis cineraria]|uniref:uncharacterized protein LOC129305452 n=1 Tax=Prosopis cineraria TaxID=364024 RepID=UPI002410A653|nr:uncharacterized protein LOC129305452 [Prosopis cineraria]
MVPTPIPKMSSMKWKDLLVGKGQFFPNVDAFRQALYKYSVSHKFSYKFKKNNKEKIVAYCKVEGCEWNIAAYSIGKDNEILRVTKFNNDHTHNAQDNLIVSHPARSKLTSSIMVDALRSNIDKGANELARDLYREYGVRLSYSQAYRGREKALREIHGRAEDSYSIIPWICDRLMETDPMTVAKWNASNNRFERLFIAYGCSISGFLGAYAIVSGETLEDWSWFLQNVKDITRSMELTIVSDWNNAIIGAVQAIFGSGERHAFCYRHVKENFSTAFMKINRESFNLWIVKERKHNVNVLIHKHREKLAKKMVACKAAIENWKHCVGPNVEAKVMEQVVRAENLHAQIYRENLISVQIISVNGLIHLNVDLATRTCSCLAWQLSGIPCATCAAIKLLHGNVYNFMDECYKFTAQEKIYASSVKPIATHDCPRLEALTMTNLLTETFLVPPMTRRPLGRPKSKRRESQFQNKKGLSLWKMP